MAIIFTASITSARKKGSCLLIKVPHFFAYIWGAFSNCAISIRPRFRKPPPSSRLQDLLNASFVALKFPGRLESDVLLLLLGRIQRSRLLLGRPLLRRGPGLCFSVRSQSIWQPGGQDHRILDQIKPAR